MSTIAVPAYPYVTPQEIIVAFDPSDATQKAMECAKSLARRFGSHVTIAHVTQAVTPVVTPESAYFEDMGALAANRTEAELDQAVEELRADGLKADKAERWGNCISDELQSLACEKSADLLVLGTHAPHGLDRLFFGSVAEGVAESSGWPVMIVGPNAEIPSGAWSPAEIVGVIAESRQNVSAAVYGYHLSRTLGASFALFTIRETGSEIADSVESELFLRRLAEELPGVDVDQEIPRREIRQQVAKESVLKFLQRLKPGGVVMSAEAVGSLHTHLHRDLLAHVVEAARCPVIVVARDDRMAKN